MQINFAIPQISHFRRWFGDFFFPLSGLQNLHHFISQLVKKVESFLHFQTVPTLFENFYPISTNLKY